MFIFSVEKIQKYNVLVSVTRYSGNNFLVPGSRLMRTTSPEEEPARAHFPGRDFNLNYPVFFIFYNLYITTSCKCGLISS